MSNKIYKTAMGKTVDLGALMLQNENVRAVGNMNVNARGDLIDGEGNVIDPKNQQIQRQYQRMATNVDHSLPTTSNRNARQKAAAQPQVAETVAESSPMQNALKIDLPQPAPQAAPVNVVVADPIVSQIDTALRIDEIPAAPVAPDPVLAPEPVVEQRPLSGLAAAIARAKTIKQPDPSAETSASVDKTIRRI